MLMIMRMMMNVAETAREGKSYVAGGDKVLMELSRDQSGM